MIVRLSRHIGAVVALLACAPAAHAQDLEPKGVFRESRRSGLPGRRHGAVDRVGPHRSDAARKPR